MARVVLSETQRLRKRELLERFKTAYRSALSQVEKLGFNFPTKVPTPPEVLAGRIELTNDAGMPDGPTDLTTLSSQELGALHTYWVKVLDYFSGIGAKYDVQLKVNEQALKDLRLHLVEFYLSTGAQLKPKSEELRLLVETDPDLEALQQRVTAKGAAYRLISNRLTQIDKYRALISREITRREQELERELRDENVGRKRGGGRNSSTSRVRGKEALQRFERASGGQEDG